LVIVAGLVVVVAVVDWWRWDVGCENLDDEEEEEEEREEGIYRERREGSCRSSGANLRPRVEEDIVSDF
jgi:hypothetical protein